MGSNKKEVKKNKTVENKSSNRKDTNILKEFVVKTPMPLMDFLLENLKDLSKEVVEALVKRIVVGVEHAFTVEYKFDFGE